jgi:tetratricopeptide (TPR) repeat protein
MWVRDHQLLIKKPIYTQAIDNPPEEDEVFVRDVYRKRASAALTGRHFDSATAMEDALAFCSGAAIDGKAHCRAVRAAYEFGLYDESKDHFKKTLESNPRDPEYRKDYNCAKARIGEYEEGLYDFGPGARLERNRRILRRRICIHFLFVFLVEIGYCRNWIISYTCKGTRGTST